jgi:hypothetical protein
MSDTKSVKMNTGKSLSKTKGGTASPAVRAAMDSLAKNPKTIKLSRSLRPTG